MSELSKAIRRNPVVDPRRGKYWESLANVAISSTTMSPWIDSLDPENRMAAATVVAF